MKHLIFLIMLSLSVCAMAANPVGEPWKANSVSGMELDSLASLSGETIFVQLETPHEETGAKVTVNQKPEISYIVTHRNNVVLREDKGFRIQVFSSNRGSVARDKALKIEKELLKKHPNLDVYVIYEVPFWKVRIGNCTTQEVAQELRMWVIEEYPDYALETYIVPSKILVQ